MIHFSTIYRKFIVDLPVHRKIATSYQISYFLQSVTNESRLETEMDAEFICRARNELIPYLVLNRKGNDAHCPNSQNVNQL